MADRELEKMNLANMQSLDSSDCNRAILPISTEITPQPLDVDFSCMKEPDNVKVSVTGGVLIQQTKRKRGRPRKYGPDGTNSENSNITVPSSAPSSSTKKARGKPHGSTSARRQQQSSARGKPPGSGSARKQQQSSACGTVGVGFTPHVIGVNAGEDVLAKVISFSQNSPRVYYILSAKGSVSRVSLRKEHRYVPMNGPFEILSITGSIPFPKSGRGRGRRSTTCSFSVSLAGSGGCILGGVASELIAASHIQVVIGSFFTEGRKEPEIQADKPLSSTPMHASSSVNPIESS